VKKFLKSEVTSEAQSEFVSAVRTVLDHIPGASSLVAKTSVDMNPENLIKMISTYDREIISSQKSENAREYPRFGHEKYRDSRSHHVASVSALASVCPCFDCVESEDHPESGREDTPRSHRSRSHFSRSRSESPARETTRSPSRSRSPRISSASAIEFISTREDWMAKTKPAPANFDLGNISQAERKQAMENRDRDVTATNKGDKRREPNYAALFNGNKRYKINFKFVTPGQLYAADLTHAPDLREHCNCRACMLERGSAAIGGGSKFKRSQSSSYHYSDRPYQGRERDKHHQNNHNKRDSK
jgi:hypothetical protein